MPNPNEESKEKQTMKQSHTLEFEWWGINDCGERTPVHAAHASRLKRLAWRHMMDMMLQGFREGELHATVDDEEAYRGHWSVEPNCSICGQAESCRCM